MPLIEPHDERVHPLLGRIAGAVLLLAGAAAAWALLRPSHGETLGFDAKLAFYGILGGIVLVAMGTGMRLLLHRGPDSPRLPQFVLWLGAVLVLVSGLGQIVLYFVVPQFASPLFGVVLAVGGSWGAVRLARERSGGHRPANDA